MGGFNREWFGLWCPLRIIIIERINYSVRSCNREWFGTQKKMCMALDITHCNDPACRASLYCVIACIERNSVVKLLPSWIGFIEQITFLTSTGLVLKLSPKINSRFSVCTITKAIELKPT